MAALIVVCYQTTQVQPEDDILIPNECYGESSCKYCKTAVLVEKKIEPLFLTCHFGDFVGQVLLITLIKKIIIFRKILG